MNNRMHTLRAFYCHEQIIECTLFEHSIVMNEKPPGLSSFRRHPGGSFYSALQGSLPAADYIRDIFRYEAPAEQRTLYHFMRRYAISQSPAPNAFFLHSGDTALTAPVRKSWNQHRSCHSPDARSHVRIFPARSCASFPSAPVRCSKKR